jgi:hypothetical protein
MEHAEGNMKITGEQLFFLTQVLKDSLDIQGGYGWVFKKSRDQRRVFYDDFIRSILCQQKVQIPEADLSKIKN